MGEEAIRIAIFSSGFLGVIAMAFAMGLKSKWARGDSTEMNPEGKQTQIEAIEKAIREGKYSNLSDAFLTESRSSGDTTPANGRSAPGEPAPPSPHRETATPPQSPARP